MKSMLIVAVMTVSVLCIPAFGLTTAEGWFNKGIALEDLGKNDEALCNL